MCVLYSLPIKWTLIQTFYIQWDIRYIYCMLLTQALIYTPSLAIPQQFSDIKFHIIVNHFLTMLMFILTKPLIYFVIEENKSNFIVDIFSFSLFLSVDTDINRTQFFFILPGDIPYQRIIDKLLLAPVFCYSSYSPPPPSSSFFFFPIYQYLYDTEFKILKPFRECWHIWPGSRIWYNSNIVMADRAFNATMSPRDDDFHISIYKWMGNRYDTKGINWLGID